MYSLPLLLEGGGTSGAQYLSRKKREEKSEKRKKRKKEIKEKEAAINLAFISMDEFNFVLFYFKSLTPFLT